MGKRVTPCTRAGRWWLLARYSLRRHEMTGRRVKGLRWRKDVGTRRVTWHLGAGNPHGGVWVGWEWPG